ncbi:hypothetical protein [Hallella colorans]|nr:hypothetical protein [Hallella colorans]
MQDIIHVLRKLNDDKRNKVVVNSGRNHATLERWFVRRLCGRARRIL